MHSREQNQSEKKSSWTIIFFSDPGTWGDLHSVIVPRDLLCRNYLLTSLPPGSPYMVTRALPALPSPDQARGPKCAALYDSHSAASSSTTYTRLHFLKLAVGR